MTKGILRKEFEQEEENARRSRKLQWDEKALNEAQEELNNLDRVNSKITEPKTPFIHSIRTPSKSPSPHREVINETIDKNKISNSSWSTTSSEPEELTIIDDTDSNFDVHRKDHYDMKDAFKMGKRLITTDDEEEN